MNRLLRWGWLAIALSACGETPQDAPADVQGSLTLALTGMDSSGVGYRLRNAEFDINGYPDYIYDQGAAGGGAAGSGNWGGYNAHVSSETNPNAATISTRLVPGSYNVSLSNFDWYLERTTAAGTERVGQAVLLTGRSQYFYIWDGGVSQVTFRFGVDGQLIDFRNGELTIDIAIEKPGDRCTPNQGGAGFAGPFVDADAGVSCGAGGAGGGF